MVFNEMELLPGVDLADFAADVHLPQDHADLASLLLDLSESRGAIEAAADYGIPVPAVFSQNFLVSVVDKLLVAVAFGNEEYKFIEEDVVFVDFLEV